MDSPCESESSLDGGVMLPPSPVSREQLQKRIESLTQQNRVLKVELETYKIRVKVLQEENRSLRQASVIIQAKAEQEEEYISNTLLKKIQALKKEKETLAHHYEREEECLTNDLSRKLDQLRQEKCKLEQTLEQEQECLVNKLMRKIEKLEAETFAKQTNLEQLRREMVELENTLEQEQEALVNKLWKRMDKLEAEKRTLQIKLDQPVSDPTCPKDISTENGDTASNLSAHIQTLRSEVTRLRSNLAAAQKEASEKTQQFALDERCIREENLRLQRKLQLEVERREALCRHLSESESSLEMEEERFYNESVIGLVPRQRTISSPIPHSPSNSRPLSPGIGVMMGGGGGGGAVSGGITAALGGGASGGNNTSTVLGGVGSNTSTSGGGGCGGGGASGHSNRCYLCGQIVGRRTSERFVKPAIPTPVLGLNTSAPNILNTQQHNSSGGVGGIGGSGGSGGASLNSSLSSSNSTLPTGNNHSISFGGQSAFAQPASPMDTSVCKD